MLAQLASLMARIAARFGSDETKTKANQIKTVLTGGFGEGGIPLGRQKETLHFQTVRRGTSGPAKRGESSTDGKATRWIQFDWPPDEKIDGCCWHSISWRLYQNGLVSLSVELSKDKSGLDIADLLGHRIELRDRSGFVLGFGPRVFRSGEAASRWPIRPRSVKTLRPWSFTLKTSQRRRPDSGFEYKGRRRRLKHRP